MRFHCGFHSFLAFAKILPFLGTNFNCLSYNMLVSKVKSYFHLSLLALWATLQLYTTLTAIDWKTSTWQHLFITHLPSSQMTKRHFRGFRGNRLFKWSDGDFCEFSKKRKWPKNGCHIKPKEATISLQLHVFNGEKNTSHQSCGFKGAKI